MSIALTNVQSRSTFKWIVAVTAVAAVALVLVALNGGHQIQANAATPAEYGLMEGDVIRASNDIDLYIVNSVGAKRLFTNPAIFNVYKHIGWSKVKTVPPATRDAFVTSGLFRNCQTNSPKVYALDVVSEDIAQLHWLNVTEAQALAYDPAFASKVFCINTAEMGLYGMGADYTSTSQIPIYSRAGLPSGTPIPVGNVNASLSPSNPASGSLTKNAQGVELLRVRLTGTGTLSTLTLKRSGAGATGDFSNVYVYDGAVRLADGRSISSATGEATFVNLNLAVNGTKDISIVGDLSSATAGNVHVMSVTAMGLTNGIVGGVPVMGNAFTVSGATGGTITVAKTGNLGNPQVGQSQAQLSQFKLTTATEAGIVKRITLLNGGTISTAGIKNVVLKSGTNQWTGVVTADDYLVFDLGTGFTIAKGNSAIFDVYGDLAGKKDETVKLYFDSTTDILATGDQFGFGMAVTNTALSSTSNAHSLTLQGGVLTLSFVGPSASNISTNATKVHFLDFDVNAASAVEMKKHTIILCKDTDANGTYDAASDTTSGWGDVTNITIIDRDTNASLISSNDGSSFTTSNTSCPGGVAGAAKQYSDTIDFTAGQTRHLAVVGDVNTANTGGVQLTGSDAMKVIVDGYGDAVGSGGDTTILKYIGTNTGPVNTDVVPAGDISGNTQTLQASSLALSLASSPTGNQTFVQGTQNVSAAGFNLTAALGSSVTINSMTLTGYVADSGTTLVRGVASAPDASLNVGRLAATVRLVDAGNPTVTIGTLSSNNLTTSTGTVVFNNMNWLIPAGTTKTLLVKTDLSTIPVSGSSDVFSFDIVATTDVSAVDQNSNSINASVASVNGTTSPTTYVTVNSVGTLTPSLAPSSQTKSAVYWGQTATPFSTYRFTSTNEGFFIERLNVYSADTAADVTNNVDSVTITYKDKSGNSVSKTQTLNSAASTSFGFSGTERPYVPKDGTLDVSVTANIKTASQFFRAADVNFSFDFSGGAADEFRAIGEGSGTVLDGATSTIGDVLGNNLYVYRAYPQFTMLAAPATTIAAGQDIFKFKVDSIGLASDGATVFFDGATGATSGSMKFAVLASGAQGTGTTMTLELRRVVDELGASVDQLVASRSLVTGTDTDFNNNNNLPASLSMRFRDVTGNQSIEIGAGKSNTFILRISSVAGFTKAVNTNTGRGADYVQVLMKDNQSNLIYWTDKGGTHRINSNGGTTGVLRALPMTGPVVSKQ